MEVFETANILVALGGDLGNTVPKYAVPAGEIAVLQMIHGKDAIIEIEPLPASKSVKRLNRIERARLEHIYSSDAKKRDNLCVVDKLYPGAAARIFTKIEELDLAEVQFKKGHAPAGATERFESERTLDEAGRSLASGAVTDEDLQKQFGDEEIDPPAADDDGFDAPAAEQPAINAGALS